MQIDYNEKEMAAMQAFKEGDREKGHALQREFIDELHEYMKENSHCSCKMINCPLHGKCIECVAAHRGHGDHLPDCLKGIVNKKIESLSELTEHSFVREYNMRNRKK